MLPRVLKTLVLYPIYVGFVNFLSYWQRDKYWTLEKWCEWIWVILWISSKIITCTFKFGYNNHGYNAITAVTNEFVTILGHKRLVTNYSCEKKFNRRFFLLYDRDKYVNTLQFLMTFHPDPPTPEIYDVIKLYSRR